MKIFIKLISVISVLAMLLTMLPSCGDDAEDATFLIPTREISDDAEYTEGNYRYVLYDDGSAAIIEHTGDEAEIEIPSELNGHKVITIGSGAFYGNQNVTSVTIPDTVETIGSSAFNGCMKLEYIYIPTTLWEIYPDAFTDTPWLESLKDKEFVIVGDSVLLEYNGTRSTVVIPNTVKHISAAFCGNETIKDVTIPDSVFTIGCAAFASSTVSRVEIGNNVVAIGNSAFSSCIELYYVNIPDSVKRIESYAFVSCSSLNWIRLGKGVEYIGTEAFYRASQFTYIYLPKSLVQKNEDGTYKKTIADYAFGDCSSLLYVFFEGSEEDFTNLDITGANADLSDATKIYNYSY